LQDAIVAEGLGIPAIGIMTSNFVTAAELMSRVLGADGYEFVVIDHPISSAGQEELMEQAVAAAVASAKILMLKSG